MMLMSDPSLREEREATPPAERPLRVLFPGGLSPLARESGIGAAIRHQQQMVRLAGHEVVTDPRGPVDVVHLNTPFPDTPLWARWARRRGVPVLMWAHSTEEDFRDSFPGSTRLAPLFRRWIAGLYRRGDVVVTPSDYSRGLIAGPRYGITAPVRVLSNGVDTRFFRPDPSARDRWRATLGLPAEAEAVVCVGMQLERKGILDWLRMAAARPEVTFVWYGRTDPRMLTAAVSRALAAAPPNVRFPGYVDADTLRDAYAGADAFCFLSREETEGIVLLEALACGTPVLVRGIPLYREQFPDGVLTHQVAEDGPDLPGRAAARLRRLLDGDLADLREAGRGAAAARELRVLAGELEGLYRLAGVSDAGVPLSTSRVSPGGALRATAPSLPRGAVRDAAPVAPH